MKRIATKVNCDVQCHITFLKLCNRRGAQFSPKRHALLSISVLLENPSYQQKREVSLRDERGNPEREEEQENKSARVNESEDGGEKCDRGAGAISIIII